VFLRDDHRCQYCGRRAENLDHVIPGAPTTGTTSWRAAQGATHSSVTGCSLTPGCDSCARPRRRPV
jgi:hypothetical protein